MEVSNICIVCVLYEKDKLTAKEARAALWEQVIQAEEQEDIEHMQKLYAKLEKEEKAANDPKV